MTTTDIYEVIYNLLTKKNIANLKLPPLENHPDSEIINKIFRHIHNIRELSLDIADGNITTNNNNNRGYVLSNLKKTQTQLRHIVQQCDLIAEGNYSRTLQHQKDISLAFEKMLEHITKTKDKYLSIALIDELTNVNNRRAYDTYAHEAFIEFTHTRRAISILYLDVDNFKTINDSAGHLVGDFVLREYAHRVRHCLRKADFFARIGGDEFIVFLPGADFYGAEVAAKKIIHCISKEPFHKKDIEPLQIETSIGYTSFLKSDTSFETIVNRADHALYLAKQAGKNQAYGKRK